MDPLQNKRTASLQNSDPTSHQYKNTSGQTKSTHKRHDHPRLPDVPKIILWFWWVESYATLQNGSFCYKLHGQIVIRHRFLQKSLPKKKQQPVTTNLSQKWIPIVPTPRCGFCARWSHGTRLGSLEKKTAAEARLQPGQPRLKPILTQVSEIHYMLMVQSDIYKYILSRLASAFASIARAQRCFSARDMAAAALAGVVQPIAPSQGKVPWWHHLDVLRLKSYLEKVALTIHPWRLTWNLRTHPCKKENLPIHHFQVLYWSLGVQKSCYQSCLANKSSVARSWPRTSSMPAAALGNILMDTLARPIVNPKVVTSQFPWINYGELSLTTSWFTSNY